MLREDQDGDCAVTADRMWAAGPGLLAHVLVKKYADRLPLYRQSQIFKRDGIDLERSTLADWVGRSTALLELLAAAIGRHAIVSQAIFAVDAPVKMQAADSDAVCNVIKQT